jgi:putative membrane protein insertion efficiency factor
MNVARLINNLGRKLFIFLIVGLRPLFGPGQCRFSVTCTQFATHCLQEKSFFSALWAITKRFISCNPFTRGS